MGQLVEQLAPQHGCRIAGIAEVDRPIDRAIDEAGAVDVAIDFSLAGAVRTNLEVLARRRISAVIGATGWQADEAELRGIAEAAGIGVLASANFSIGMTVFRHVVAEAARRYAALDTVGAWIHELHHAAKADAPSGTARLLQQAMREAGYAKSIDVSSTRAGSLPGTHEVGFDGAAETVLLTHTVRDRSVFAHGALEAARWLAGRRGWFTMNDVISSPGAAAPAESRARTRAAHRTP
jgi:4-hydroxy-tetrahydrodipicolinate reductase